MVLRSKKQEVIVRDSTGSIKLTLWEDYVECLEQQKTDRLQNVRDIDTLHGLNFKNKNLNTK
jgi:ssDNA-binding replication factor A large subunit